MTHPIQIYTQGQMNHAQADAYRRGFDAAKAAALARVDELIESVSASKSSIATLCLVHDEIKQLTPEPTR